MSLDSGNLNDDSFLTVAEVAELLKLNQQTVRNWIDQGSLPALRVGRRVRIRQSDLNRLLEEGSTARGRPASTDGPSAEDFWVANRSATPTRRTATRAMPSGDADRTTIMREVRDAGEQWAGAMRAHKLAPPDPAFAARIRQLADAAAREQVAWDQAHASGLMWRPVPGAESAQPPYELRPGTGRRGPDDLLVALRPGRRDPQPSDHSVERGQRRGRVRGAVDGGARTRRRDRARRPRRRSRASRRRRRAAIARPRRRLSFAARRLASPCRFSHGRRSTCPHRARAARS